LGVALKIRLPLLRYITVLPDRFHRADRLARPTVDAYLRVDVELSLRREVGLPRRGMDAVHPAHLDTGLVLHVDTRFSDHVGHGSIPLGASDDSHGHSAPARRDALPPPSLPRPPSAHSVASVSDLSDVCPAPLWEPSPEE